MRLYGTEPEVRSWRPHNISEIAADLILSAHDKPLVIAVDGHSGGGKSTFARALAAELDAALLSTDDFAWWHSLFDWPELLIAHGLQPLLAGQSLDYRPDAWIDHGREGSITASARDVIIIEGVGAAQTVMRGAIDVIVWVQSDVDEAERRGIARDLAERPDPAEAKRFWDEWQAAEVPFQEHQRTWEPASLIVCGTPSICGDSAPQDVPDGYFLVAGDWRN
jgi:uridine kinase